MKHLRSSFLHVAILGLIACGTTVIETPAAIAETTQRSLDELWAAVLQGVVRSDGVDYAALRRDRSTLKAVQAKLSTAAVPAANNERMAFYINAYNALTLALTESLLPKDPSKWPSWSLRDQGNAIQSVWKKYKFTVAGKQISLDEIEHRVLRPMGDPRIHFAINCASKSCPALAATPYTGAKLDAQLRQATKAFVQDKNQLRVVGGEVRTNPILDWFAEDFKSQGGVRAFLVANLPPGDAKAALAANKPLKFFDYDWHLNGSTTPR